MRKHNEGYVLPLVLVVMVIMSLIAVGVMSVSLRNLQAQKSDIERMQAQYAAQGQIETAMAKLTANLNSLKTGTGNTMDTEESDTRIEDAIHGALTVPEGSTQYVKLAQTDGIVWTKNDDGSFSCTVSLYATDPKNQVRIDCTILLEKVITAAGNVHFYQAPEIVYTSYEMTSMGGDGGA